MTTMREPAAKTATVVIPLYQDSESIAACLESLLAQTIADRLLILVVDDGSRDGGDLIAAQFPVTLIRQTNAGPAAARNRGALAATTPYLIFLDSDCAVPPDWAEQVLDRFADPAITAVLCPLAPAAPGAVPVLVQSEIEERYDRLRGRSRSVDFLAGAAFAVRTDSFRRIGGFDDDFRYNEDVEFAFRLTQAGGTIVLGDVPRTLHHHQTRWRDIIRAKFWRGVWRVRLYRLYPQKRLDDSWTPVSLKIQILAALLVAPAALLGAVHPFFLLGAAGLLVLVPATGWNLLADTSRALRPFVGWTAPFLALSWIFARAFVLAAAILYARLVPWSPMRRPVEAVETHSGSHP